MCKNGYQGKAKGKGWQGFNQFVNYKGKGKGEYSGKGEKGSHYYTDNDKGKGKGKGFQGQCYWCGEWGHSQNNCAGKDEYMNYLRNFKGKGKGQYVHNIEEGNTAGSGPGIQTPTQQQAT